MCKNQLQVHYGLHEYIRAWSHHAGQMSSTVLHVACSCVIKLPEKRTSIQKLRRRKYVCMYVYIYTYIRTYIHILTHCEHACRRQRLLCFKKQNQNNISSSLVTCMTSQVCIRWHVCTFSLKDHCSSKQFKYRQTWHDLHMHAIVENRNSRESTQIKACLSALCKSQL